MKYAVFKGKHHEGNVRGGNLHKERENIYNQQGILKEIITQCQTCHSISHHLQNNTLLGKIGVMITNGKDNRNFHDGGNEGMSIRVWGSINHKQFYRLLLLFCF